MFRKLGWTFLLSVLSFSVVSCEETTYGITLRDSKEKFTLFREGSAIDSIAEEEDGSVSWITSSSNGAGGGGSFYFKSTKEEINIANYESIDIELDYSIVEEKWNATALNPRFIIRILPWDSTGMFGGYEDLVSFETDAPSGTISKNFKIPTDISEKVIASSEFDSILGFGVKFNDYLSGNNTGDQLKVVLKNIKLNAKEGAPEDKAFDDGLTDDQRGTVVEIKYQTRDYLIEESALTDADRYEKRAWVYLPPGYDASDVDTKYPLFFLMHGGGQNENSWGLTNKGRGGKIKGFVDRGIASGEVEKFVLVVPNGVASKTPGREGIYAFGGEFRNDLFPYINANFNVKEGRDNVAFAGLSMGGWQTMNIAMKENLDIISYFGIFSMYLDSPSEFVQEIDANPKFEGLKIHQIYYTVGDNDNPAYEQYPPLKEAYSNWDRVEKFDDYIYPGGTHDFPVWFKGFHDFIPLIFKNKETQTQTQTPVTPTQTPVTKKYRTIVKKVTKCRPKKY